MLFHRILDQIGAPPQVGPIVPGAPVAGGIDRVDRVVQGQFIAESTPTMGVLGESVEQY